MLHRDEAVVLISVIGMFSQMFTSPNLTWQREEANGLDSVLLLFVRSSGPTRSGGNGSPSGPGKKLN